MSFTNWCQLRPLSDTEKIKNWKNECDLGGGGVWQEGGNELVGQASKIFSKYLFIQKESECKDEMKIKYHNQKHEIQINKCIK